MVKRIRKLTPEPIKACLTKLGVEKLLRFFYDKREIELAFQKAFLREFEHSKDKVLEYWKRYRYLEDIEKICKITEKSRILDVGCGVGTVLHYVKGERFGIDPLAEHYLKIYKYPQGINVSKSFGEKISFPDGYFDIIFCSNVLDHVADAGQTIDEIHRVLNANGYVVLTVEIFREKVKRDLAHPRSFLKSEVYSLIENKFDIIFERESPWIGIDNYLKGARTGQNKELILILRKHPVER